MSSLLAFRVVVVHQQGHAGNLIDELIRHGESLKVVQKRLGYKGAVETHAHGLGTLGGPAGYTLVSELVQGSRPVSRLL
jgi:hypothetical protein